MVDAAIAAERGIKRGPAAPARRSAQRTTRSDPCLRRRVRRHSCPQVSWSRPRRRYLKSASHSTQVDVTSPGFGRGSLAISRPWRRWSSGEPDQPLPHCCRRLGSRSVPRRRSCRSSDYLVVLPTGCPAGRPTRRNARQSAGMRAARPDASCPRTSSTRPLAAESFCKWRKSVRAIEAPGLAARRGGLARARLF